MSTTNQIILVASSGGIIITLNFERPTYFRGKQIALKSVYYSKFRIRNNFVYSELRSILPIVSDPEVKSRAKRVNKDSPEEELTEEEEGDSTKSQVKKVNKDGPEGVEPDESTLAYLMCDVISYTYTNNKKRRILAVVNLKNKNSASIFEDVNPVFHDIVFDEIKHIQCYFETLNGYKIEFIGNRPITIVLKLR